jgi:hypothetical protein
MGLIIWYKVVIDEAEPAGGLLASAGSLLGLGLPLTVSNDALALGQILDADVTLTLLPGPLVSRFEVVLYDLPADLAKTVAAKQQESAKHQDAKGFPKPLRAKMYLGYFEDAPALASPDPVMDGYVTWIKNEVDGEGKYITRIKGEERGGYRLRNLLNNRRSAADKGTVLSFLDLILHDTSVELADGHGLTDNDALANYAFNENTALDALKRLAADKKLAVVLRDNRLYINQAVGDGNAVAQFSPDTNLVSMENDQKTAADPTAPPPRTNQPGRVVARARRTATVLGDASLKVGLRVAVKDESPDFRLEYVKHSFSSKEGFISQVQLGDAKPGDAFPTDGPPGIQGAVNALLDAAGKAQRPAIDVGEVKEYVAGSKGQHRATLNYGQSPQAGDAEPSVATPLDADVQLTGKPLASPFAWHRCGLMVPVYPGMRALLAHNRGDTNDAVVGGFLWAQAAPNQRPANEAGDYWLCLPTQVGGDGLPTGPAANDLTTGQDPGHPGVPGGLRVIQAAGLHIQVGVAKLADVGTRPGVDADLKDKIIIEHASGTTITVASDGSVQIKTGGQKIDLTNGQVSLTLNGASVEVK